MFSGQSHAFDVGTYSSAHMPLVGFVVSLGITNEWVNARVFGGRKGKLKSIFAAIKADGPHNFEAQHTIETLQPVSL